jgi:hypothetical protein
MRSLAEGGLKHEDPEHWRLKAVELRRRAMSATDGSLASRLHANAEACIRVGVELARGSAEGPWEPAVRALRSSFAAPLAVLWVSLLAWTAQVVLPTQRSELTNAAATPSPRNAVEHYALSGADADRTNEPKHVAQNDITFPPVYSPEVTERREASSEGAVFPAVVQLPGTTPATALTNRYEVAGPPPQNPVASKWIEPSHSPVSRRLAQSGVASSSVPAKVAMASNARPESDVQAARSEGDCRAYVADDPRQRGQRVTGVACRLPNGRWKIQTVDGKDGLSSPARGASGHYGPTRH